MRNTKWMKVLGLLLAIVMIAAACGDDDDGGDGDSTTTVDSDEAAADDDGDGDGDEAAAACDGEIPAGSEIEVQAHEGNEAEKLALEEMVESFNSSQEDVTATLVLVPEGDYAAGLSGSSAGGDLAGVEVVEMDASFAFTYAWNGDLQPIDSCVEDELRDDLLPSILEQGTYADQLWALGMFDSGLAMWASKSALEEAGARIPEDPSDGWTIDEFDQVLADLQAAGFEQPLDLKVNYGQGEFYSYGFAPIVWSAGGDLVDRDTYETADGFLNSPEVVAALERFQAWYDADYVDANEDDAAFIEGRSALSWAGHWETARYSEALGDDLILVPLADFGDGMATGQGSWQWAMGSDAVDADAAWAFLSYLMAPEQVETMTAAAGAIPARKSVADTYEPTSEGGIANFFVVQHDEGFSVPRPPHPSYQTISSVFNEAIGTIASGGDVQGALDEAVASIDQDLEDNDFYPEPSN